MNGTLQDMTYEFLQIALSQNLKAVVDGEFDVVWDFDARDRCERICQIVMALSSLKQLVASS